MNNNSKLTEILRDAVSDYTSNSKEKTPAEWLQGYLGKKLPEKSIDTSSIKLLGMIHMQTVTKFVNYH